MKYYLMRQDKKAQEVPKVINWFQKVNTKAMEPEMYEELAPVTVLEAVMAVNTQYKELVLSPFLLLPNEAAVLLKAFEPWMKCKTFILWDSKKKVHHRYEFPLLKRYDCLSEESVFNRDRSELEKGVLKKDDLPDQVLFMPEGVNGKMVIVREDFVEALLQNHFFGYSLTQFKLGEK